MGVGVRGEEITNFKTIVILAAAEKSYVSAWRSSSGSLFQRVGATLRSDFAPKYFSFVFSPSPETLSLHREEERRERGGVYAETNFCRYCGVVLCTHW